MAQAGLEQRRAGCVTIAALCNACAITDAVSRTHSSSWCWYLIELVADQPLLLERQARLAHQPLHEVAVAQVGGDAPGGDVGLVDQPVFLHQRGEFVGRTVAESVTRTMNGKLIGELFGRATGSAVRVYSSISARRITSLALTQAASERHPQSLTTSSVHDERWRDRLPRR